MRSSCQPTRRPWRRGRSSPRPALLAGALLLVALVPAGVCCGAGGQPQRIGGCQTAERDCGLPAVADSSALAALDELLAPGAGAKAGPVCRALGVDTRLFVQIGSVNPLEDEAWRGLGAALTDQLAAAGIRLAERSLLRHTTGPCFPPHHLDFRACGDAAAVQRFLDRLGERNWPGYVATPDRRERKVTITAGRSLQLMDTVVHLK